MKINLSILGSTGSIGKSLVSILKKEKKKIKINLLSSNKNYKELFKQAKYFNVKNLIITDKKVFKNLKTKQKYSNYVIHNNFDDMKNFFMKKNDYVMNSISGLDGLEPTLKIIKYTKKIAIANKESLICGWNLIKKELKKNNTLFVPVDSEHYSIYSEIKNNSVKNIEKIYLTASGGPFLGYKKNEIKNVKINDALRHPNWVMGKKISIDSATMMNKVFEVIEAKNIFNLSYRNLDILIHPRSYIHAIIKYKNGLSKIIIHETDMKIPIFNSIFENNFKLSKKIFKNFNLDFTRINNPNFQEVNLKEFPLVKIIHLLPNKQSLFETVLVSANDELVSLFLNKKIKYLDIPKILIKIIKSRVFQKFKKISPDKLNDILRVNYEIKKYINEKIFL